MEINRSNLVPVKHNKQQTEYTKQEETGGIVLIIVILLSALIAGISYIVENLK